MREGSKGLRRLGFAALFMLAASVADAQVQQFSTGQRNLACGSPAAIGDGWPTAVPESVGLDRTRLCGIAARLAATNANVHAVIVVRRGTLVFEQYFPGYDEPWGMGEGRRHEFDAVTKHDMRSVSKSVISLLVGIAIDRDLIKSADEPVVKFFPDYSALKSPGWDSITLRHLLTMSSGIKWDENRAWKDPENDEPHLGSDADPFRYGLSKPIAAPPDTVWNYNGGGTDLLGNIIERVSGKSLDAFAREALFTPLGISDWEWMKYRNEHIASAAGLRLRPRDAAKIGQLVLNKGAWNGQQVVSAKWIEQSVTPRFQAIGYFGGLFYYGQQWWMGRTLSGDKDVKWIAAQGLGGQRIFIVPELDLVLVTTSGLYGSGRQGQAALDILANFIIPYVRD
ncbi:serine hydrolase [Bradyrhizobium sp. 200]|uniref:serine hydrolase domain-containing protein n=1 Tax=Bradyrhizobium sp. 200 TaxID=2782665 RepID=UPI001FFFE83D|nr:serine hydrolase [Bradyrhizobium sp. 200]